MNVLPRWLAASVKFLKDLAEIMGPHATFVVSQDDKARVPLGIPAATKESPILMHLDYRVKLPDHDFPLGSRHKLIPSVYAGLTFDGKGRTLTYAGPTYIAIRSGKHEKSCARSHANDFRKLVQMPLFESLTRTSDGSPKPIVIIFTDGGPDENPRFEAVINEAIEHFKELNLGGLFIATHAPGQSAMNQVERRMAPLSHDLSGLILPHNYYGTHLDGTRTVDIALEVQNFQKAGETLAEIWSSTVINGNEVFAEYIKPSDVAAKACRNVSEKWYSTHVRSSQYLLQIIKCADTNCCSNPRSCHRELLHGFLPGPVPLVHSNSGLELCESQTDSSFYGSLALRLTMKMFESKICQISPIPFDWSCPSIHDEINGRIYNICNVYFCSKKAVVTHKRVVHSSSVITIMESIESVVQKCYEEESDEIPVIFDMLAWLQSPFTVCTPEESN